MKDGETNLIVHRNETSEIKIAGRGGMLHVVASDGAEVSVKSSRDSLSASITSTKSKAPHASLDAPTPYKPLSVAQRDRFASELGVLLAQGVIDTLSVSHPGVLAAPGPKSQVVEAKPSGTSQGPAERPVAQVDTKTCAPKTQQSAPKGNPYRPYIIAMVVVCGLLGIALGAVFYFSFVYLKAAPASGSFNFACFIPVAAFLGSCFFLYIAWNYFWYGLLD